MQKVVRKQSPTGREGEESADNIGEKSGTLLRRRWSTLEKSGPSQRLAKAWGSRAWTQEKRK